MVYQCNICNIQKGANRIKMAWKTGQSGNKKGRPKLNEKEKQNLSYFKQQLKQYSVVALEELFELMTTSFNQDIKYKCETYILDRCYGKDFVAEKIEETDKELNINLITRCGQEVNTALIDEEQELWKEDFEDWENDIYLG